MNILLALYFALLLAVGNFIPLPGDDTQILIVKVAMLVGGTALLTYKIAPNIKKIDLTFLSLTTLIFLLSLPRSTDPTYALDKYLSASIVTLTMLAIYDKITTKSNPIAFAKNILKIGILILFLTCIYKLQFGFFNREVRFFLNGSIVFGWIMGGYALISLIVSNKEKSVKYLLYFIAFSAAVLWSESKGALVSLAIASLFHFIQSKKPQWKTLFFLLLGSSYFFIGTLFQWAEHFFADTRFAAIFRVLNNNVQSQDEGSITVRSDMINESLRLFSDNWTQGIGLGNYSYFTQYSHAYPHNIHLEIFLEAGFFVGLLYLLIILYSFIKSPPAIKTLILFFFIAGSFSGDMTYLRFLLFASILGLSRFLVKNRHLT